MQKHKMVTSKERKKKTTIAKSGMSIEYTHTFIVNQNILEQNADSFLFTRKCELV